MSNATAMLSAYADALLPQHARTNVRTDGLTQKYSPIAESFSFVTRTNKSDVR